MIVSIKDALKFVGISIVACCGVFVCTLFLNYNIDLPKVKDAINTQAGIAMYEAHVSMGKAIVGISGGCLVVTAALMLLFYIKNYIDSHGRELGILKALGYSDGKIALRFWVFGLCTFVGAAVGFAAAYAFMPRFYKVQNADALFPPLSVGFHPWLLVLLVLLPSAAFAVLAVLYALFRLKTTALALMKGADSLKVRRYEGKGERPFLSDLKRSVLKSKKAPVFFVAFSAFCFSAMTQMSISMLDLASATMGAMILVIGLILAYMTLFMSLTSAVKENAPYVALLGAFGYTEKERNSAVLGGYRFVSYIGFVFGTLYQYILLKIMVVFVFSDIAGMPDYSFDFVALAISVAAFVLSYELVMLFYSRRISKLSLKQFFL